MSTTPDTLVELLHTAGDEELILKDSFPLSNQSYEAVVFKGIGGLFGVVEVLHSYEVPSHSFKALLPDELNVEDRTHVRSIIRSIGYPLIEAATPTVMVRGILHGLLGTLFNDSCNYHSQYSI